MAGGIFQGYPFTPNLKCVIFTALLAGGYWYMPPHNVYILIMLLWAPYIALSWYDYKYECKQKLGPTIIPFGRTLFLPLKAPYYKKAFNELPPNAIRAMDNLDHLIGWSMCVLLAAYFLMRHSFQRV
jgi:hypothetical protein